ncbi:MAG: hypothetical protein PVH36_01530 [Desulfobacterales bacterium]
MMISLRTGQPSISTQYTVDTGVSGVSAGFVQLAPIRRRYCTWGVVVLA